MNPPTKQRSSSRVRASNRIRFALERFILRGLGHRLLIAAAIVVAVAVIAGILVAIIDPELSEPDATTVLAYLKLRGLLPPEAPCPRVFVELLEEENLFLFDTDREDVIVSPLVVSYLLSQVALRRELGAVFEELSQPWGAQIILQPAENYLPTNGPVRFGDLDRAAASRGEIALGFRLSEGGLVLNPERDTDWALAAGDEVVVLTSYAERDPAGSQHPTALA